MFNSFHGTDLGRNELEILDSAVKRDKRKHSSQKFCPAELAKWPIPGARIERRRETERGLHL